MLEKTCLLLLLMFLHIAAANLSLWNQVVKMEQVILAVEYNQRHLNVWKEKISEYDRFFVTPLCTLETASLKCRRDDLSGEHRHKLSFKVKMWDLQAAETVKLALAQKNIKANVTDIIPLPMLKVRLGINHGVEKFTVDKEWRSVQNLPKVIAFQLYTRHEHFCDEKLKDARSDPEEFLESTKMYIEFTMVVGQPATRSLNITGQTFIRSKFLSNLENEHSNETGIIYLVSSDLNKLAKDVYRNAIAYEEVDSTYIPSENENKMITELMNVINSQTVDSKDFNKDDWNSVFWNDIFSRPDVQTEYFNEALKYDEGEKQFKYNATADRDFMENTYRRYRNKEDTAASYRGKASILKLFGGSSKGTYNRKTESEEENQHDVQRSSKDTISIDDLQKHLKKDNVNVKWTGTKFTPKDLSLHRINTKSLKSSGELFFGRIEMTKYESTQKIEIRPEPTLEIVNPVFHEEFKNQVAELKKQTDNTTLIFQTRYEKIEQYFDFTTALLEKIKQDLDNRTYILQRRYENVERNLANRFFFNLMNPPENISITPGSIVAETDLIITAKPKLNPQKWHFELYQQKNRFFSTRMEYRTNGAKFFWNTYINGLWGRQEEKGINYPFKVGSTFVFKIEFKVDRFFAYIDGQHMFTFIYRPGFALKHVDSVSLKDDSIIERIELKVH